MKLVSMGSKKKVFKSIRLAAEAAGVKPITFYMRIRMGMTPAQAAKKPVRKYVRQEAYYEISNCN